MNDNTDPYASAGAPGPSPAEPVIAPPMVPAAVVGGGAMQSPAEPTWTSPVPVTPPVQVPVPAPVAPAATSRGVGPRFVVGAVVAATIFASGGTYLAVSAANGGRDATASAPILTNAITPEAPTAEVPTASPAAPAPAAPAPAAPAPGGTSVVEIVKAVSPAVVTIVAEGTTQTDPATGQSFQGAGTGSGVIFDASGLVLTNHHVVAGDPQTLTVHLKDGRSLDASIYGIDTLTDLAIVKVEGTDLPTAPIGDSSTIEVGQVAIAIGSPLGTFTDSVTSGIISAVGRDIPVEGAVLTNLIQTDTAINPGNSGGPLLDPSGKVIGINTAVAGDSQGIGFAIPIDIARPLIAQASAGQPLARAWLGIRFTTIDPSVKEANGLPADSGAWIPNTSDAGAPGSSGSGGSSDAIVPDSPAALAGLQAGDIITAVDGTALDATNPLDLVTSQLTPGQTVALTVLRDGVTVDLTVTLGTRPATL